MEVSMNIYRGRHARPWIITRAWRRFVAWNEAESRRLDLELEMKARAVREARLRRSVS
jgi:hypothetical protein